MSKQPKKPKAASNKMLNSVLEEKSRVFPRERVMKPQFNSVDRRNYRPQGR